MTVPIEGFWTTRAGDYSPVKSLQTTITDYRFFFRLNHDSPDRVKRIIQIFVDGKIIETIHDWMSNDGREDNYFDVPLELRTPGTHFLQFKVFEPVSEEADAIAGNCIFESEVFYLEYSCPENEAR